MVPDGRGLVSIVLRPFTLVAGHTIGGTPRTLQAVSCSIRCIITKGGPPSISSVVIDGNGNICRSPR
jgi:hypothetical protein